MVFIQRLGVHGLLSFDNETSPLELKPLNVLIGPNGSGKSNIIEVLELLRATPADFAGAIRDGGGAEEWLWKGAEPRTPARIDIRIGEQGAKPTTPTGRPLRYHLEFAAANTRLEILDEAIEDAEPSRGRDEPDFYYRFQRGRPVINVKRVPQHDSPGSKDNEDRARKNLPRDTVLPDQSVLAQRKEPELYPEVTWLGREFSRIQTFRDWSFGRYAGLRRPQPADLPEDRLLPDCSNLALLLNQIEHRDGRQFNQLLKRFFPRFERMSTKISGGAVQCFLHEEGFTSPIPPTRLSDGTLRFMAILVALLDPAPPPLLCIEGPELGMHPDAVALIGDLLVEASERMQLVVTTHSEALVSALTNQPETIIACERPGASTTLRRLDGDHLRHWLEEYSLGDLWRMGELGANP